MTSPFKYENDPLKHHVRLQGWLPLCRERHDELSGRRVRQRRRLRYFTFCAVGAVDVLLLDVEGVIRRSSAGRFDTVYFFDRTPDLVAATQERIPGSKGFVGNFVQTVLSEATGDDASALGGQVEVADTEETRNAQRQRQCRLDFERSFPFDVINLDLQDLIFRERDQFPGRLLNALRRVLEWQRRPLRWNGREESIQGFSLLFTTRIGPTELREDYAGMLMDVLEENLRDDAGLRAEIERRSGVRDVDALRCEAFDTFFEIGVSKILAKLAMEQDWYVDPVRGIRRFKFERGTGQNGYYILHYAMDVCRQSPPVDERAPGAYAPGAEQAYRRVSRGVFSTGAQVVTRESVNLEEIEASLGRISARRRKYLPD